MKFYHLKGLTLVWIFVRTKRRRVPRIFLFWLFLGSGVILDSGCTGLGRGRSLQWLQIQWTPLTVWPDTSSRALAPGRSSSGGWPWPQRRLAQWALSSAMGMGPPQAETGHCPAELRSRPYSGQRQGADWSPTGGLGLRTQRRGPPAFLQLLVS